MPYEAFTDWKPKSDINKALLTASVQVINEYAGQGYRLTLRQLYYQLVARDLIPNQQAWYKRLGDVVSNGRLAGYIDWNSIVDRGRVPIKPPDWSSPAALLKAAASQYRIDRWQGQQHHVEVWCEKDALSSVIEPVCNRYHVRFLANRGYSSSTAMYDAARRFRASFENDQEPVVIYLGDHDPSGIDMSRDVRDRLQLMTFGEGATVDRLALNMDQVDQYQPPPNPAKLTDSRASNYVRLYGLESWELDALEPQVLDTLISTAIESFLDQDLYDEMVQLEETGKDAIREAADTLNQQS